MDNDNTYTKNNYAVLTCSGIEWRDPTCIKIAMPKKQDSIIINPQENSKKKVHK